MQAVLITEKIFRQHLGGISRTTFWQLERDEPSFPKPVRVTPGRKAYVASEVEQFISKLVARRNKGAAQ